MSNVTNKPWAYLYLSTNNDIKIPLFNKKIEFGRSQKCEFSFPDNEYLSSKHGYIEYDDLSKKLYYFDTSTNGTWINLSKKLKHNEKYELKLNDRVFLVYRLNNIEKTLYFDIDLAEKAQDKDEPEIKKIKVEIITEENKQDDLLENLSCQICYELMHDAISLQPCLHSFCAGCYSEWMTNDTKNECLICRIKINRICKNHVLNNIIDAYLKNNPNKKRPKEQLERLDEKNKIKEDIMIDKNNEEIEDKEVDYDEEEEDEYDIEEEDNHYYNPPVPVFNNPFMFQPANPLPINNCRQCPANKWRHPNNPMYPDYTCSMVQNHLLCSCCLEQMPDRSDDIKKNKLKIQQKCYVCLKVFCNLYWKCNKASCNGGCLFIFQDFKFDNNSTILDNIINNNLYETKILKDYLKIKKNQTVHDLIQELLRKLKNRAIKSNIIKGDFVHEKAVCKTCGLNAIKDLIYEYRLSIPKEELPDNIGLRPDCRWGKECRTQVHNIDHAKKFNHVCNLLNKL